jgi:uncharacterized protein YoxC|tara:strand:- start:2420 stop:2695 length:276 start_codon:yes stop_codon:yes gene_type:complete
MDGGALAVIFAAIIAAIPPTIAAWTAVHSVKKTSRTIDHELNSRPPGAPTLREDIAQIRKEIHTLVETTNHLHREVHDLDQWSRDHLDKHH